jgi:hypothetical protein
VRGARILRGGVQRASIVLHSSITVPHIHTGSPCAQNQLRDLLRDLLKSSGKALQRLRAHAKHPPDDPERSKEVRELEELLRLQETGMQEPSVDARRASSATTSCSRGRAAGPRVRGGRLVGAASIRVGSAEALLRVASEGCASRATSGTDRNDASSRSHAMLIATVTSRMGDNVYRSKVSVVDLAGSERNKHTCAAGERLTEAKHINTDLSALKGVFQACEEQQERRERAEVRAGKQRPSKVPDAGVAAGKQGEEAAAGEQDTDGAAGKPGAEAFNYRCGVLRACVGCLLLRR